MFNINFLVCFPVIALFFLNFFFVNFFLKKFWFAHVMFLFLFFLFHNLNLELCLPLFSFWLENLVDFIVFVPVTAIIKNWSL